MTEQEKNQLKLSEQQLAQYVCKEETSKKLDTQRNMEALFGIHHNGVKEALNMELEPGFIRVLGLMYSFRKMESYYLSRIAELDKKNLLIEAVDEIKKLDCYQQTCRRYLGLYLPPTLSIRLDNYRKSHPKTHITI